MSNHPSPGGENGPHGVQPDFQNDDSIDLRDLFFRLTRGLFQIIGFALLGLAIAAALSLAFGRAQPTTTSTRVTFTFPGFERGEYPDRAKFQPDDLRAPAILAEALSRQGLDTSSIFQSRIRGALSIEGIVPANIIKERDRLRAAGQTPPSYIPDEYILSLSMQPSASFNNAQREQLLREIVTVYRENFYNTYGQPPISFGTAFDTLKNADFAEYELVLNSELSNIRGYLSQQNDIARSFRSAVTSLSFKDLNEQIELFAQIQLNEVLGIIRENGLSRNRATAMLKMNYHLRRLDEQENQALEEEKLVRDLLNQAQTHAPNYVLGIKNQSTPARNETPVLDQGLINSLLANDSYNFLVRRALDAGLEVKRIQAEKQRLVAQRDNLKTFINTPAGDQTEIVAQSAEAIKKLESAYHSLIENIRKTQTDFSRQQYAHAIRVTDEVRTVGILKPMAISGLIGGFLGLALGAGLSLIGVYVGQKPKA